MYAAPREIEPYGVGEVNAHEGSTIYRGARKIVSNDSLMVFWRSHGFAVALTVAVSGVATNAGADVLLGPIVYHGPVRPKPPGAARVCSFSRALCVTGDKRTPAASLLAVLAAGERAWDLATGALALPPPDADPGTGAYDIYLVDKLPGTSVTAIGERDPRPSFDRASAYTLLDAASARPGCALERIMAREVTRAILFRVAPATDDGSARAETAYLARLMVPCAMGSIDEISIFQAFPDRGLVDTWQGSDPAFATDFGRGGALFFWWLDDCFGTSPGAMVRATWALSPTKTPPRAWRFTNEPDGFDVLRMTFKNALTTNSTIDDLFLNFAAARALTGTQSDPNETHVLGDAAAARLDWEISWPTSPRRLASPHPLEPTGSSYVSISRDGAPKGSRLRVEASWEEHAKMRWVILKLDANGREKSRILVPMTDRATEAQTTVVELDDTAKVVIVAMNAGDFAYSFDPDDEVFEPHGWLLTVAAEN